MISGRSFALVLGLLCNMIQLKVFYNISFAEDRCEVITTDENQLSSCEDLMQIVRDKIECLQFIPDEELRIQYKDDEDTFVNLRFGDSFHDALRCAQAVSGTTFRRLKVKIQWQPKSTPEVISSKRREMEHKIMETGASGAESKRRLLFNVEKSNFLTSTTTGTNTPGFSEYFSADNDLDSKSPPRKQRVKTRPDRSVNSREGIATMPEKSCNQYKSPLDLLIEDKQVELEKERKKVSELQRELERLSAVYGKHPGVDYSRLACTNCHRREGHNRLNCPYKGHPCFSSKFCGDLNKHKDLIFLIFIYLPHYNNYKRMPKK